MMTTRTTINRANAQINKHGFEVLKLYGYYYLSPTKDDAPYISTQALNTKNLNTFSPLSIEKELLYRIAASKNIKPIKVPDDF